MIKPNGIPDMETYTTWMLISTLSAILAICGGIIGSWGLLGVSVTCLLLLITKAAKFYIPLQRLPIGG